MYKSLKAASTLAVALSLVSASFAIAECQSEKQHKEKSMTSQTLTKDIVDTAVGAGNLNTLVTAVKAADLVETLKGKGPFTVFAPTDAAFKKIPEKDLQALLADKDKLTAVLTYHVVPGEVKAQDVVKLKSAKTVQGGEVKISVNDGAVKINDATVTATDIACSNGVVHIVDTVILPPSQ